MKFDFANSSKRLLKVIHQRYCPVCWIQIDRSFDEIRTVHLTSHLTTKHSISIDVLEFLWLCQRRKTDLKKFFSNLFYINSGSKSNLFLFNCRKFCYMRLRSCPKLKVYSLYSFVSIVVFLCGWYFDYRRFIWYPQNMKFTNNPRLNHKIIEYDPFHWLYCNSKLDQFFWNK